MIIENFFHLIGDNSAEISGVLWQFVYLQLVDSYLLNKPFLFTVKLLSRITVFFPEEIVVKLAMLP